MARNKDGTIKKGTVLNPKGRPKGSKNKATSRIREFYSQLIEDNQAQLKTDLQKLKPFERVRAIIELSKYVLPTLKSVEFGNTLEELSDEDLQRIINELKKQ